MSDKKRLDKAIDALAEAMIPGFGAVYAATTSAAQMFEDAAAEINRLKAERKPIPVGEVVPEKMGDYLAYLPGAYGWEVLSYTDEWNTTYVVSHWLPLPADPEAT